MVLNRCADQRSAWSELRIVSNGLKRGRAALNCGQGGLGVRNNQLPVEGKKVVCVVSGGNIDVNILARVITRGLIKTGRRAELTIELLDKPGQLVEVASIIASLGANVTKVDHNNTVQNTDINGCYLTIQIETRNFEHIEEIRAKLVEKGFKLV